MGDIGDIIGENATEGIEPQMGFDPIPAGWYPVEIERAEVMNTKQMNGKYLKMQMVVIGDSYTNRKLFANINLSNPNPKCVEIGLRELAALEIAVGDRIKDTSLLLGKQISVRVVVGQDMNGEPDNEVKAYRALDGVASAPKPTPERQVAPTVQPRPSVSAPAAAKRPWEK